MYYNGTMGVCNFRNAFTYHYALNVWLYYTLRLIIDVREIDKHERLKTRIYQSS